MKSSKKTILILVCLLFLTVACLGRNLGAKAGHALRISELLQPMLSGKDHTMHLAVSAVIGDTELTVESEVSLVEDDGRRYLVVERKGNSLYIVDNLLLLENGKAFGISDKLQSDATSLRDLLPHIVTLYQGLNITAEEREKETVYTVTLDPGQADTLLTAASLGGAFPVESVESLKVCLTEKNGKPERILCTGRVDGTAAALEVTLSGFRLLAPGERPIPETVKERVATVDPEELFSLTRDLYRLVPAVEALASRESLEGTLMLAVDCGLIQLDTEVRLSDLQTTSPGQLDPEQLRSLPETLGWLCMEGEIGCTRSGNAYVYTLTLDRQAMGELSRMLLPELGEYGGDLSQGSLTVTLEADAITSMTLAIRGNIRALLAQIPITLEASFRFD